jgi:hypothetical protein
MIRKIFLPGAPGASHLGTWESASVGCPRCLAFGHLGERENSRFCLSEGAVGFIPLNKANRIKGI